MTIAELVIVGGLLHFVGDYILQSHWMATEKTVKWWPAIAHTATYTAPFLFITRNPIALAVIGGTHLIIDHYRLARHLVWLKNHLGPRRTWRSWAECSATGYPPESPVWLTTWLMIVADNVCHIGINSITLWVTA